MLRNLKIKDGGVPNSHNRIRKNSGVATKTILKMVKDGTVLSEYRTIAEAVAELRLINQRKYQKYTDEEMFRRIHRAIHRYQNAKTAFGFKWGEKEI